MRRKILSVLMALCILFALLPTAVSADGPLTGMVNLQKTAGGSIEKISAEQAAIQWNGDTGTQTLTLEEVEGESRMNAHYNIVANAGYYIVSATLYPAGGTPSSVSFYSYITSGGGGFFGRVLDGSDNLIAGALRWMAADGDRLEVVFGSTSASRATISAEGEMGLSLAQTLPGANNVIIQDTFSIANNTIIQKDTEIQNGTVTVNTGAVLNINGCSFGPNFTKDITNPSVLINNGTINVNSGGELVLIDENSGSIVINSGGVMEAGVINKAGGSITVESGGEVRCAMGASIQNAGQFTVDAGGTLKPQKGRGFCNSYNSSEGTLTLNGDVVFNQGFWSDFSQGTVDGAGRFIINYRIETTDLTALQSVISGKALTIVNETVVDLGSSADYSAFKAAVTDSSVRAVYLSNAVIAIDEDLSITDKNIYLEGTTALTLNSGKTLTLTDTGGTGSLCSLTNNFTGSENSTRPSTSFTVNGRMVLANGASLGGYIGTITIGDSGVIDNSDGSIRVRYPVYCNGSITNMGYADRADTGHLCIFTNGVVVKNGVALLGEQSGSVNTAQNDAAVSSMSISRDTELLNNTIYDGGNAVNITLTKNLTVSSGTLLWVPKIETYGNYVNLMGNTPDPSTGTASLTVDSGVTLTIAAGGTLRLNGPLTNNGTLYYNGSVTGDGAIGGTGLFVLAPNTTIKITTGGGTIKGANDAQAIETEAGKGYTVGSDGILITSHSIYAADNSLDLTAGSALGGLTQNGAALAPPVGLAQAAVAAAGLDTEANYAAKLSATLESVTQNNGTTLVYDIKPQISENGGGWTDITALEGNSSNNTAVVFRLPVPADTAESYVRIVHKNGDTVKSIEFYPVLTDVAGNKYAEITTKSFSTFQMSFTDSIAVVPVGGSSSDYFTPVPVTSGGVTSVSMNISSTLTGTSATATVTAENMSKAITAAAEDAAKSGSSANINLVVGAPETADEVKATIPTASISRLTSASSSASLTVSTPVGDVRFDSAALAGIDKAATGTDITISVAEISKQELTSEQRTLVGDRPVIDLSVMSDGKSISDFGGGSAAVSIPYTLAAGESADGIVVWYLADNGTLTPVKCSYQNGELTFNTNHFSKYVLAYFPFDDINGEDWYYENVAYAYTNGLMDGVGNGLFSPSGTTTRGMLVTILWRLEGSPVSLVNSFTDVAEGKWYANAVSWASAKGIVEGYGGKFNPETAVTREQMAAILYRYATYKGYDLSGLSELNSFTDAGDISDWAGTAMKWAVKKGLISGIGNSKLDPSGNAQRAQVAAVLQRFIENAAN